SEKITARAGYIRLHGRNVENWFRETASRDERYDYLYNEEELQPWVDKIRRMRDRVKELYVVTNNHYRGQAIVNALELARAVNGTVFELPDHLVAAYPRLAGAAPEETGAGEAGRRTRK
ncbi:MAG: DUF72 domain-containing protein, partial [Candidatus Hydrogenedentes bacterium]|nr:DUF72 domain-containing protein [Candidatus Hydrogenedentota bacterium]